MNVSNEKLRAGNMHVTLPIKRKTYAGVLRLRNSLKINIARTTFPTVQLQL